MTGYVLSPAAERDLFETFRAGVRTFGAEQAGAYQDELGWAFDRLAEFPLMGRELRNITPPARVHHHGRHYVIYRVRKTDIRILRILRDDADLGRHLRRIR